MARCLVCEPPEEVPDRDLLHHLRNLHPEQWGDGIKCWPDGSPVITVEPESTDAALREWLAHETERGQ